MRIKLDENVPVEAAELFAADGHDCHTVYDQALAGAVDGSVIGACQREARSS